MLSSFYSDRLIEAGCDEAGRGCLAGPVFAAAVILDKTFYHPLLNDSKKLTEKQRYFLREIIEKEAISWQVASVSAEEIDDINILNASFLAMNKAVTGLSIVPELLLIDGNRFRTSLEIPYECIIKGDGKYASIAAASILAKTYRDDYMHNLSVQFPEYEWSKNKGYPTAFHREVVMRCGMTEHHRKTFKVRV